MIEKVSDRFKELFTERCNTIRLLDLGEDSVRYDFFMALIEIKKLRPYEIQLEFPSNHDSFILRNNKKSKRGEKPLIDLVVDKEELKFCVEFALFKQNSNEKGTINKTAKTVKMINDMIRLGNESYYTKRKAYFVCVADDKMLGHQLQSKILGVFPSNYLITMDIVKKQMETKTSDFDERFIKKFEEMNCSYHAKIIYNEKIEAKKINRETRMLIWEMTRKN